MKNLTPLRNATAPKNRITLLVGKLAVTLNPPYLHIGFGGSPSQVTLRELGPPRLMGGLRANHLTIPFEAMKAGPLAGYINVHLTYRVGTESRHVTVAKISPEAIAVALKPFAEALGAYYLATARHVTLEELQRDGYKAVLFNASAERWLDERLSTPRWKERLTRSRLERIGTQLEFIDAELIEDMRLGHGYQTITFMRESDAFALSVGYQPLGLGPERPPGWYAMPLINGIEAIFDALLPCAFGVEFYDTLMMIGRELQADIDLDALRRGRARALEVTHARAGSTASASCS